MESGRYTSNARPAEGWTSARQTPPSRLYSANGIRAGKDGRIYVAQVGGSQIAAVDPDSGDIDIISPMGGAIVAPDDLVFDDAGNLYVTEITEGRVTMLTLDGRTRVIDGDMPVANPITLYQDRLIAGECRPGGRIFELDRNGGPRRTILDDVPMPNAFTVGPDGKLYAPIMAANQIWRIDLAGGGYEVVAGDLGVPDSVKFDSKGRIVSTQVGSGQVLRIDPQSGAREVLADLMPGLDNCTFVGERLFVSSIPGALYEITAPGVWKPLIDRGLQWPLGLAIADGGALFVADGGLSYWLQPGGGALDLAGMFFTPGYPGYIRGVVTAGGGAFVVTTANGDVARFWPKEGRSEFLANGLDRLMGVALLPGGAPVFAEYGAGRLLTVEGGYVKTLGEGLDLPMGVAVDASGTIYVAETGAGRVVKLAGSRFDTVVDGLDSPHGLAIHDGKLFIVDAGAKTLIESDLAGGARRTIATDLPVGAPPGIVPKYLGAVGTLAGPMIPWTGITAAPDGTLYVSGDAEGSVLAFRPL